MGWVLVLRRIPANDAIPAPSTELAAQYRRLSAILPTTPARRSRPIRVQCRGLYATGKGPASPHIHGPRAPSKAAVEASIEEGDDHLPVGRQPPLQAAIQSTIYIAAYAQPTAYAFQSGAPRQRHDKPRALYMYVVLDSSLHTLMGSVRPHAGLVQ